MSDNKPKTVTTTNQTGNKPQSYAETNFKKASALATKTADDASAWKPYEGSTVVDQSADTLKGLDMMRNNAQGGVAGLPQAQSHAAGVVGKGGVDRGLTGQYGGLSSGVLDDYASGDMLNKGNPYLMKALEKGADQVSQRVNESAAGAGRYGSGTHQGVLADSIGSMYSNALANDYQQGVGNMMAARQMQKGNLDSQIGAEMQGDQLALGAGQGMAGLYQAGMMPAQTYGQIGSAVEGHQGLQLQDTIDKYYANRDIPKNQAEWLNAIAAGSGSFGSKTETAQIPVQQQSPWQTAAGIGMMSAGF